MRLGEICTRNVVTVERSTPVQEMARMMRSHHADSVIVIDQAASGAVPVGIVTDHDIVVQVIAPGWKTFGEYYEADQAEQTINIELARPPKWY